MPGTRPVGRERKDPIRRNKNRRRTAVLAAAAALGAAFLIWQQNSIVSEEIPVFSPRLPAAFSGFRITIVSDVHGKEFAPGNARLLAAVAAQKPDLIAVTGDLVENERQLEMVPALMEGLAAIAPTYYVTGNHEWAAHLVPQLLGQLRACGVTPLENAFLPLERNGAAIALCGVHDPNGRADQKTAAQLLGEAREKMGDPFLLLLAHRNSRFPLYAKAGADLVLSGHGHGGIIRLSGTDGVFGTENNFFPTWTAGRYELEQSQLVVSRGLGNVGKTFRVFNRPHLPVVILEGPQGGEAP